MRQSEPMDEHEHSKELCALASHGLLSVHEQEQLDQHLKTCDSCRLFKSQYSVIGEQGMAFLLAEEELTDEAKSWDNKAARERLRSSLGTKRPYAAAPIQGAATRRRWNLPPTRSSRRLPFAALAACAVLVLMAGAYRAGSYQARRGTAAEHTAAMPVQNQLSLAVNTTHASGVSSAGAVEIARLEKQLAGAEQEIVRLRAASIAAGERADELASAKESTAADLQRITAERDQLASDLAQKEKAYEVLQTDYSILRADHDRSLLSMASLESELKDLQSANQNQQSRLKDDEQYLTSDRDIRELMGARKLYIADVFDVDGASHTRKPFGRVFYTQNKSLIFYAFDLDHQPGVKNASVFQVWGQRDSENNNAAHPMNLGILYMDSETNRRWVLQSDDPKQLAEIDAVFVTVEPHGGSPKPTGKPLLYALLRKEVNHP